MIILIRHGQSEGNSEYSPRTGLYEGILFSISLLSSGIERD